MTESDFQRKLRRALQARLPKAVIWKHNDRFTAGIPDISVTHEGRTTWLELKVGANDLTPLQRIMLDRVQGYAVKWHKELWSVYTVCITKEQGNGFLSLVGCLEELCR